MPLPPAETLISLALLVGATLCGWALTGVVLHHLRHKGIFDIPGPRSSHTTPVARGGGWGVMLTVAPGWAALAWTLDASLAWALVIAAVLGLMAINWIDDKNGLGIKPRLLAQIAAVALVLATLPGDQTIVTAAWPVWLDRLVVGLLWVWFINLFNFMDGIDGLAGSQAALVGLGVLLVVALAHLQPIIAWSAAILAGAALGFLKWNWSPAQVFMGDVGSIPLGFLIGWLLIEIASAGYGVAALILPLYFLADATLTLVKRALRGDKIWNAHREHFYQHAVQAGHGHAAVVTWINGAQIVLLACAAWATLGAGWRALVPAAASVAILLWALKTRKPGRSAP